jgi:hypothetical protein
MTEEQERIVKAIWGDREPLETQEEVEHIVNGVIMMAEYMRRKSDQGLTVVYDAPIGLH